MFLVAAWEHVGATSLSEPLAKTLEIVTSRATCSLTARHNDSYYRRFNDLKGIDKIANVQAKVDAVTGVMQKNIESALRNTDRIEDIDEKAVVLADSAAKFKNAGAALKRNMRCRYFKMIILFTLLVAGVLTVIIVPLALKDKE